MLAVTSLYASILAILIIGLAYKVVNFRQVKSVGIGDNGDKGGLKVIRVHANAVEYVPMIIILMGIYEVNGGSSVILHGIGITVVVARLLHAMGLSKSAGTSFGRFVGTLLTWLTTLALAGLNLYHYFF